MRRITQEQVHNYPPGTVTHTASGYYAPDSTLVEAAHTMQEATQQLVDTFDASDAVRLRETNVNELEAALAGVTDPAIIQAAMGEDARVTAAPLYHARLQELTDAEE